MAYAYHLLFEEQEEWNIVIVVRHVGIARLAFRRGHGIEGSLSAVECAGPVPEEFGSATVHGTDRPIVVAFDSGQFGGHRSVDFAVILLEMLGIVGCLVENDEFDHLVSPFVFEFRKRQHCDGLVGPIFKFNSQGVCLISCSRILNSASTTGRLIRYKPSAVSRKVVPVSSLVIFSRSCFMSGRGLGWSGFEISIA